MAVGFSRHYSFLAAFAAGIVGGGIGAFVVQVWSDRATIAVDVFFATFLFLTLWKARRLGPSDLRAHAERSDEGLPLILALALLAIGVSLVALFLMLNLQLGTTPVMAVLALASVPLGWSMLHTLAAFHYAALYYQPTSGRARAGGLTFPGTAEPGPWDFLYLSFVIGMTAQVSDVVVTRTGLRLAVLAHSALSFFYNTVIVALAVNAAIVLGR